MKQYHTLLVLLLTWEVSSVYSSTSGTEMRNEKTLEIAAATTKVKLSNYNDCSLTRSDEMHCTGVFQSSDDLTSGNERVDPTIKKLKLRKNNLVRLQGNGVWKQFPNLEILDLLDNSIGGIDDNVFNGLTNLKELVLSNNAFAVYPIIAMSKLQNLQKLIFAHNKLIGNIKRSWFSFAPNLEEIDLCDNKIEGLDGAPFEGTLNLKKLNLSKNSIRNITAENLSGLKNLKVLVLKRLLLKDGIPEDLFTNTPAITYLNMEQAGFSQITAKTFQVLPELEVLQLSWNLYKCDCSVEWIWAEQNNLTQHWKNRLVAFHISSSPLYPDLSHIYYCSVDKNWYEIKNLKESFCARAEWQPWSAWSNCSHPCHSGVRTRTRNCKVTTEDKLYCRGSQNRQTQGCTGECITTATPLPSRTTPTTPALVTITTPTNQEIPSRVINKGEKETPVDTDTTGGTWSVWSSWSPCTKHCTKTRMRTCQFPKTTAQTPCIGDSVMKVKCYRRGCLGLKILSHPRLPLSHKLSSNPIHDRIKKVLFVKSKEKDFTMLVIIIAVVMVTLHLAIYGIIYRYKICCQRHPKSYHLQYTKPNENTGKFDRQKVSQSTKDFLGSLRKGWIFRNNTKKNLPPVPNIGKKQKDDQQQDDYTRYVKAPSTDYPHRALPPIPIEGYNYYQQNQNVAEEPYLNSKFLQHHLRVREKQENMAYNIKERTNTAKQVLPGPHNVTLKKTGINHDDYINKPLSTTPDGDNEYEQPIDQQPSGPYQQHDPSASSNADYEVLQYPQNATDDIDGNDDGDDDDHDYFSPRDSDEEDFEDEYEDADYEDAEYENDSRVSSTHDYENGPTADNESPNPPEAEYENSNQRLLEYSDLYKYKPVQKLLWPIAEASKDSSIDSVDVDELKSLKR